jgi:hypothetical protein
VPLQVRLHQMQRRERLQESQERQQTLWRLQYRL